MEQRTCNIIMCCKGHWPYTRDPVVAIKQYMGRECKYPWENYTKAMVNDILFYALQDYIDGVPKPSFVLGQLKQCMKYYNTIADGITLAICDMFAEVEVKNDKGYVNSFTAGLVIKSEMDLEA